jgi:transposase-like protein
MSKSSSHAQKTGPGPRNELRNAQVKFCPICKESLTPKASRNRLKDNSTRYECELCKRVFEINDITPAAV